VESGGKHIGFTGTRKGMTDAQRDTLTNLLTIEMAYGDVNTFHHGCEEHADREAAKIAKALGFRVIGHPGPGSIADGMQDCDEVRQLLPYLERNRVIVDSSSVLYAAPSSYVEQQRSGTWLP